MADNGSNGSARSVALPEHLWDALETMAREMGMEREALVSQAVFTLARLNGYVVPGQTANTTHRKNDHKHADAPVSSRPPKLEPGKSGAPIGRVRPTDPALASRAATVEAESEAARRVVADRVLETAAQLEQLIKQRPGARDEEAAVDAPASLFLAADDGKLDPVSKDRYLIGRGKHCDLVINSGKVSREHAAIVRESGTWFIEDLGSSNGTWFDKQRIKRRKIEDGDEYFVCSEKLRCVLRSA